MKKITVLLICVVLALTMMISPAFAAADGDNAAVSAASGKPGDVVELTVSISDFEKANAVAVTFEVPAGLTLVKEKSAWLVADTVLSDIGDGYAACAVEAPQNLNGNILKLAFRIGAAQDKVEVPCKVIVKKNDTVLGEASATGVVEVENKIETTPMYRLYNPNIDEKAGGEHFYTGSEVERDNLVAVGWVYEGVAWNAPISEGDPVYRLFNPNNGDHHYTMSWDEVQMLEGYGWNYEGVCWNSASPDNLPLYRLFNPNIGVKSGGHHYTGSVEERDFLVGEGWNYEGIGWFGIQ